MLYTGVSEQNEEWHRQVVVCLTHTFPTSPMQPFTIDSEGVIRNTEPLDYERSHNHILSAVAYDCGMKRSQPVMVTIKVNRVCRIGWKGESGCWGDEEGGREAVFL